MYDEWPESSVLLKRHTLLFEGRPITASFAWGVGGSGPARCSCGETSPVLTSGADRKRWHRRHKAAVARISEVEQ